MHIMGVNLTVLLGVLLFVNEFMKIWAIGNSTTLVPDSFDGPAFSRSETSSGITITSTTLGLHTTTTSGQHLELKKERVCRGTNTGLGHNGKEDELFGMYKAIYTNCTYVDGNLELVFLNGPVAYDLSFLGDIKEVTGYVLIVANYAEYIPLKSLRIIRGRTLYDHDGKYYSLYVALNFKEGSGNVGLKELRLTSLHEVLAGSVFFFGNKFLCFEKTINWTDILTGEGAQVVHDYNTTTNCKSCYRCGECHEICAFNGVRHCWGAGPDNCQKLTKLSCSAQCDGRCFGELPNQCCYPECAGGCVGPSKSQCWACKNFNNDGNCENFCPPEFVYNPTLYRQVPNRNAKYAYGTLCVDKCPSYLMADRGACVQDCGEGRIAGKDGKCEDCDGPCPKTCSITLGPTEFIHLNNIDRYNGCTILQGSIKILTNTFDGDKFHNIKEMSVAQLSVLETIQEVTEFVQIQANRPDFKSLSFLKNLKTIDGRNSANGASLQVFETSLTHLGLESLTKITYGTVFISNNSRLCYTNTVNWTTIKERENQRIMIQHNRNDTACAIDNEVCSSECTAAGCWGPMDDQCVSCTHDHLGKRCLRSCEAELGVYRSGPNECQSCHPECKNNCTGKGSENCGECRNARDGPYCVPRCPASKYRDEMGVCQMCSASCDDGCKGPRNTVDEHGCNSCALAMFDDIAETKEPRCLAPNENCTDGFYKSMLPSHFSISSLSGKQACKRCDPECGTCIGHGLLFCTSCKHYMQDRKCVPMCSSDYFISGQDCLRCDARCLEGCTGPTAHDCLKCKEYKLYEKEEEDMFANKYSEIHTETEKTLNNDGRSASSAIERRKFLCTDKCPERAPYPITIQLDPKIENWIEIVCATEDSRVTYRRNVIIGSSCGGAVLFVILIFVCVWQCCKRQKSAKKCAEITQLQLTTTKDFVKIEPDQPGEAFPDMSSLLLIKEDDLRIAPNSEIGSGAFGTVFRGEWTHVNPETGKTMVEWVAIKILRDGTTPMQNKEVLEEARVMATVDHPCCSKILGACMTHNMKLVTKLLPLGCMLDYIRKNHDTIGPRSLLRWCKQIAEGMDYLESRQIIHRDLAARNVLIESTRQVKITDFGLAKILIDNDPHHFAGGKMPIKWLALESLNQRIFTHKSDVWSYGVTIWELLTFGARPYEKEGWKTAEIPLWLEKGERLQRPPSCREEIYQLMLRCWYADPDKRPSFKILMERFADMSVNPELYLTLPRDNRRYLPSRSSDSSDTFRPTSRLLEEKDSMEVDEYLEPQPATQPSQRRISSRSNQNKLAEVTDDEMADDVFNTSSDATLQQPNIVEISYARGGSAAYSPRRPTSAASKRDTNNVNRYSADPCDQRRSSVGARGGALVDLTRDGTVVIVGGTPVWTRRNPSEADTEHSGRRVSAREDDYLQPLVSVPVPYVDLLDGHYPPPKGPAAAKDTKRLPGRPPAISPPSRGSKTEFTFPGDRDESKNSAYMTGWPGGHSRLRQRMDSVGSDDGDISSSTLAGSEPDYYNDMDIPLTSVPLLAKNVESPV